MIVMDEGDSLHQCPECDEVETVVDHPIYIGDKWTCVVCKAENTYSESSIAYQVDFDHDKKTDDRWVRIRPTHLPNRIDSWVREKGE